MSKVGGHRSLRRAAAPPTGRAPPIGKADRPASLSKPEFGDLLAPRSPLVIAAAGSTLTLAVAAGPADDEIDEGAVVDHRRRVRHQHEARHAARRRGIAGGGSVSRYSCPGSPVNTRMSMRPGATISPLASIALAPSGTPCGRALRDAVDPCHLRPASRRLRIGPLAGSTMRALVMTRPLMLPPPGRPAARRAPPCAPRHPSRPGR